MPFLSKILVLVTLCVNILSVGIAQERAVQPSVVQNDTVFETKPLSNKSPRTASWLSAAFPGAGHIYLKQYHKSAIIWAGLGTGLYFIMDNARTHNELKTAYIARLDDDPTTNATGDLATADINALRDQVDQWRGYRDLSIIATSVGYLLNIVWASVDAHLLYFDVSDDISLNIHPSFNYFDRPSGALTLALHF